MYLIPLLFILSILIGYITQLTIELYSMTIILTCTIYKYILTKNIDYLYFIIFIFILYTIIRSSRSIYESLNIAGPAATAVTAATAPTQASPSSSRMPSKDVDGNSRTVRRMNGAIGGTQASPSPPHTSSNGGVESRAESRTVRRTNGAIGGTHASPSFFHTPPQTNAPAGSTSTSTSTMKKVKTITEITDYMKTKLNGYEDINKIDLEYSNIYAFNILNSIVLYLKLLKYKTKEEDINVNINTSNKEKGSIDNSNGTKNPIGASAAEAREDFTVGISDNTNNTNNTNNTLIEEAINNINTSNQFNTSRKMINDYLNKGIMVNLDFISTFILDNLNKITKEIIQVSGK